MRVAPNSISSQLNDLSSSIAKELKVGEPKKTANINPTRRFGTKS
jgi:hypothetical protein